MMAPPDDARNMLLREFETALRRAQEEELGHMRNQLYFYKLLRDGMAELNAELREMRRAEAINKVTQPSR
jgi:hypothetical protein